MYQHFCTAKEAVYCTALMYHGSDQLCRSVHAPSLLLVDPSPGRGAWRPQNRPRANCDVCAHVRPPSPSVSPV